MPFTHGSRRVPGVAGGSGGLGGGWGWSPHPALRHLLATCEDRKVWSSSSHRSRSKRARSRAASCPRWPHYLSEVPSPRPHTQPINEKRPPPNTTDSQRKPRCARQLAGLDNAGSSCARPMKTRMAMAFVTGIAAVAGRRAGATAAAAAAPRVALLGPARRDLGLAAHESPTAPPRVAPWLARGRAKRGAPGSGRARHSAHGGPRFYRFLRTFCTDGLGPPRSVPVCVLGVWDGPVR